jgi:hypothetical protein
VGAPLDATARLLQELLLFGLIPVWLLAGFGDWLLHRRQCIESVVGWREPALHLLMVAELGTAVLAVLLLQITAAVLVLLLLACIAHEVTLWSDLAYAAARRNIPVPEQWVHGLQIVLPWAGLVLLAVIHHDVVTALLVDGPAAVDWSVRLKEPPLPATHVLGVVLGGVTLVGLPFFGELLRGLRAAHRAAVHAPHERLA